MILGKEQEGRSLLMGRKRKQGRAIWIQYILLWNREIKSTKEWSGRVQRGDWEGVVTICPRAMHQLNACFSGSHLTPQCTLTCLPLASCPKPRALRLLRNQHKRGWPPSCHIPHDFHIRPSQLLVWTGGCVCLSKHRWRKVREVSELIYFPVSLPVQDYVLAFSWKYRRIQTSVKSK